MRKFKILPIIIMLQSCFPSFAPKEEVKKEIQQENVLLKWIDVIGTLDQDFPDYISIQKGEEKETICKSHNIASLRMEDDTIIVGFFGTPKRYSKPITIPKEILGYNIEIDTSFVKIK
jgi:hypothetical protein